MVWLCPALQCRYAPPPASGAIYTLARFSCESVQHTAVYSQNYTGILDDRETTESWLHPARRFSSAHPESFHTDTKIG